MIYKSKTSFFFERKDEMFVAAVSHESPTSCFLLIWLPSGFGDTGSSSNKKWYSPNSWWMSRHDRFRLATNARKRNLEKKGKFLFFFRQKTQNCKQWRKVSTANNVERPSIMDFSSTTMDDPKALFSFSPKKILFIPLNL